MENGVPTITILQFIYRLFNNTISSFVLLQCIQI
jgi:hypothetical protein